MRLDVSQIRPAAVADRFYPGAAGALARMVDDLLAGEAASPSDPKAIISPHAGFPYSGGVAGSGYRSLRRHRHRIRRVVLLGPAHRVPLRGFALPASHAFATPLGLIPVDVDAARQAAALPGGQISDAAHAQEHSLETQLPFLQRLLGDFTIVPVVVGTAPSKQIDDLMAVLWGGEETLIVVSSDLSHFLDYDSARRRDLAACRTIEALDPSALADNQACGRFGIKGLLQRAQALDLRATTLDYRNSGDTAGRDRRDRVVGYGSLVFEDAARARLGDPLRRQLLEALARTLASGLRRGRPPAVAVESFPLTLQATRATFVTLKLGGALRGCVGSVKAHQPLIRDVVDNAFKAAFGDRRFQPMQAGELADPNAELEASISILSYPRPLRFGSEAEAVGLLQPGVDGVILQDRDKRGLFLPQVWDSLSSPSDFLQALKRKAGLPAGHWSDDLALFRYRCESFGARIDLSDSANPRLMA